MSYRTRKLLCVLVLAIGLPAYVVAAAWVVGLFERPSFPVELAVYVGLGILWALPLKALFRGMGRPDPGRRDEPEADHPTSCPGPGSRPGQASTGASPPNGRRSPGRAGR